MVQNSEQFAEVYNNCCGGGGCFTGDSMIKMADNSSRRVSNLKKGDLIKTLNGQSKVACVIKFPI